MIELCPLLERDSLWSIFFRPCFPAAVFNDNTACTPACSDGVFNDLHKIGFPSQIGFNSLLRCNLVYVKTRNGHHFAAGILAGTQLATLEGNYPPCFIFILTRPTAYSCLGLNPGLIIIIVSKFVKSVTLLLQDNMTFFVNIPYYFYLKISIDDIFQPIFFQRV